MMRRHMGKIVKNSQQNRENIFSIFQKSSDVYFPPLIWPIIFYFLVIFYDNGYVDLVMIVVCAVMIFTKELLFSMPL